MFCKAFGLAGTMDCTWQPDHSGCGLFNQPFLGLRPRRRPLAELYAPKPKEKRKTEDSQMRFF